MPDYNWTGGDLPTFVTHLECSLTGERYPADTLHGLSRAGRPLLVRYDLDAVRRAAPYRARRSPIGRRPCGATVSCCRCAIRRTSSRSARW